MNKKLVFVSHITEEKELAYLVKDFISTAFLELIEVFVSTDENSISLGEKWLENITNSLKECFIEIIICSPKSVERPWINFEAGAGWIRGIPVIPLCHSGIHPDTLPMPLNLLQGANLNSVSELRLLLPILAKAIDSSVPNFDFSDFAEKVKIFEEKYTFWNECNNCFSILKKYSGPAYSELFSGNSINFLIKETEKEEFYKIIQFLKQNNLLDCRVGTGLGIGAEGFVTKITVEPMAGLSPIINNKHFIKLF
jgi:hypothetical protein